MHKKICINRNKPLDNRVDLWYNGVNGESRDRGCSSGPVSLWVPDIGRPVMAETVEILTHLKVTLGGVVKELGHKTTPEQFTITNGHIHEVRAQIDDNYFDEILWITGDGSMDTFELLWFESDADVFLELRSDMGTDEFVLLEIKAGIPLILTSDDIAGYDTATRFDDAVLIEDIDWAQCDQISVQRNVVNDAGDATVHLVLFA